MSAKTLETGEWRKSLKATLREIRYSLYVLRHSPLSIAGAIIISIFVFTAMFGPLIAPYDPYLPAWKARLPPSIEHLFGTDGLGRDIFSRVICGARISLSVGLIVVALSIAIGVPIGALSGFLGGKVDAVLMRIVDVFLGFPSFVLALALAAALGRGIVSAELALVVGLFPRYARLVRGQTLSLREMEYVEAARLAGASGLGIVFAHIIPNCITPILVQASTDMGFAILLASGLGFLGIGAQPPEPEWGLMCATARRYMMGYWWTVTFPGLAIATTVLGFCLLGDGLRDVMDPRFRRR